ncbi:uncharacterized protein LOC144652735 [Oculina patagonica]
MVLISVTTVFKVTIALLDKGRHLAAEKLKEGDVTDQQFRSFIVREIEDIKSKLDGIARKDLVASVSFFKEGLVYLYKVLDMKSGEEDGTATITAQAAVGKKEEKVEAVVLQSSAACMKTVFLAKEVTNFMIQLTDQDVLATRALSDAKDRFKDARRKATEAFSNEALNTADRILAMQYRVMATLLEKVDNPGEALAACRLCLEELHSMPVVQKSFGVQLKQGFKSWFNKVERKEIISSVCRINRVIFDIRRLAGPREGEEFSIWPCIDIGGERVDPVCDQRLVGSSHKPGIEHFCVTPWSFGQEGEEQHKLKSPRCIATNTEGQFIVVDHGDRDIKVFDKSGKYMTSSSLPMYGTNRFIIQGIATDQEDNMYLLVSWYIHRDLGSLVCVFDKNANLNHKFNLKEGSRGFLITVNANNKVFVVVERSQHMQVYKTNGQFVHSFGENILKHPCDITAANDGCVMVLESREYNNCVHLFSAEGDHLSRFTMDESKPHHPRFIAFLRATEQAVVLSVEYNHDSGVKYPRMLHVYTKHGEFVRSIHLDEESMIVRIDSRGITVTKDGRVAMCVFEESISKYKVYIL